MFYAVFNLYSAYDSDADTLMRFQTKQERDEMVGRINNSDGDQSAKAVTTREIAKRFDIRKFENDPYGDYCSEVAYLKTCAGRPFFEITQRPNYRC